MAALRLNLDTESPVLVTYRAIASVMNRFGGKARFEQSIEEILNDSLDELLRYNEEGIQSLRIASTSGNQSVTEQILKLLSHAITNLLDENGLYPTT